MTSQTAPQSAGYLLALGCSRSASMQIEGIRTHYYRTSGSITLRSLPPLIAVAWSRTRFDDLMKTHVDAPPGRIVFDRLKSMDGSIYLAADDPQWTAFLLQMKSLVPVRTAEDVESPPIPTLAGPYVGRGEALESNLLPVENDDWRLQQYVVRWNTHAGEITHIRYTLLDDIHLK